MNLVENSSKIKKITMSLYMMIEIKHPDESTKILSKYTLNERIYEEVYDFRVRQTQNTHGGANSKGQPQAV